MAGCYSLGGESDCSSVAFTKVERKADDLLNITLMFCSRCPKEVSDKVYSSFHCGDSREYTPHVPNDPVRGGSKAQRRKQTTEGERFEGAYGLLFSRKYAKLQEVNETLNQRNIRIGASSM